jgi:hypothetical protein
MLVNPPSFDFRGTRMTVSLSTADTAGAYAVIEMIHPPNVGRRSIFIRAVRNHFLSLKAVIRFFVAAKSLRWGQGRVISISAGTPHRYVVGPEGGRAIVICPPGLERYFQDVAELLKHGTLPIAEEFAIASRYGQDFLDSSSHWVVT